MVDLSAAVNRLIQQKRDEVLSKANYTVGVQRAAQQILERIFSDEGLQRAVDAHEGLSDTESTLRMAHAIAAATGGRLVELSDGTHRLEPLAE